MREREEEKKVRGDEGRRERIEEGRAKRARKKV